MKPDTHATEFQRALEGRAEADRELRRLVRLARAVSALRRDLRPIPAEPAPKSRA